MEYEILSTLTRVGGEILCERGERVHEGRIMAFGHGPVFAARHRFVRLGRIAEIGVGSPNFRFC